MFLNLNIIMLICFFGYGSKKQNCSNMFLFFYKFFVYLDIDNMIIDNCIVFVVYY